jgi:hypothetical protein
LRLAGAPPPAPEARARRTRRRHYIWLCIAAQVTNAADESSAMAEAMSLLRFEPD